MQGFSGGERVTQQECFSHRVEIGRTYAEPDHVGLGHGKYYEAQGRLAVCAEPS